MVPLPRKSPIVHRARQEYVGTPPSLSSSASSTVAHGAPAKLKTKGFSPKTLQPGRKSRAERAILETEDAQRLYDGQRLAVSPIRHAHSCCGRGYEAVVGTGIPGGGVRSVTAWRGWGCPFEHPPPFPLRASWPPSRRASTPSQSVQFHLFLPQHLIDIFHMQAPAASCGGVEPIPRNFSKCPCCQGIMQELGSRAARRALARPF